MNLTTDEDHSIFTCTMNKMKAVKARINIMNVFRQKKAKRLKIANKKNDYDFI